VKTCFLGSDYFIVGPDVVEQRYQLHIFLTIEFYLIFNFVMDALLMAQIFVLRNIQADFSITKEFMIVTFMQLSVDFVIFFFLIVDSTATFSTSNKLQYLMIFRGLVLLYFSAISPLRGTYTSNAIIPFPINEECIKTLEMAMLMPTSANFFYEYLETLCEQEMSKEPLVFFGLYADIRTYLRMVEEKQEQEELRRHAEQVIRDYLKEEDRQWEVDIPEEILSEIYALTNQDTGAIEAEMDETFFSSLYFYVIEMLEGYYKDFQRSRKYESLKDEVSK